MKFRSIANVTLGASLFLLIPSISLASDQKEPCPESSTPSPALPEGQKGTANTADTSHPTQIHPGEKNPPAGSLTLPGIKPLEGNKEEG
jgi:hypothetical protein